MADPKTRLASLERGGKCALAMACSSGGVPVDNNCAVPMALVSPFDYLREGMLSLFERHR